MKFWNYASLAVRFLQLIFAGDTSFSKLMVCPLCGGNSLVWAVRSGVPFIMRERSLRELIGRTHSKRFEFHSFWFSIGVFFLILQACKSRFETKLHTSPSRPWHCGHFQKYQYHNLSWSKLWIAYYWKVLFEIFNILTTARAFSFYGALGPIPFGSRNASRYPRMETLKHRTGFGHGFVCLNAIACLKSCFLS